jgi:Sulfatase-modifying factor enzyme 1
MSYQKSIALISAIFYCFVGVCQQVYVIPKQTFQPYKVLGYSEKNDDSWGEGEKVSFKMAVDSFEISSQVTFKQYKLYLESVKKDSSYNFYLSQLPDSNITSKENYSIYISNKKYDDFPVLGITWLAAMNYCKWRTLQENKSTNFKFIYRLPQLGEWLAAYNYLMNTGNKNDFSRNYSDWTITDYYEGGISVIVGSSFGFYAPFLPKKGNYRDNPRRVVIGDSYLFQCEQLSQHFFAHYIFNGFREVGFRLIKERLKESDNSNVFLKNIWTYWDINLKK